MMPLTKLWLLLLSLLCGLAALLVVALDPELQRRELDSQTQAIDRARKITSQFLENQAHQLVQAAVQMSSDAVLQSNLMELSRGQGELPLQHEAAQSALRRLVTPLSLSFALVTDVRGRVLSRVGQDEAVYGDPLDGLLAVESALRGYRLDDLWLWQGALYRIAAVPLTGPSRDRYVGSLVIAQVLGSQVLQQINQLTGVEGAFVADGHLLASSLTSGSSTVFRGEPSGAIALTPESLLVMRRSASTAASGAAAPSAVVADGDRLLTFVDLPGAAAAQGAVLVLSNRHTGQRILPVLLRAAIRHGLAPFTLAVLLGAVLLLYVLGLGVVGSESRLLVYSHSSRSARKEARPAAQPAPAAPAAPANVAPAAPAVAEPAAPPPVPPPLPAVAERPAPSANSPAIFVRPSSMTPPPLSVEDTSTPLPPPAPEFASASDFPDGSEQADSSFPRTDERGLGLPPPSSNFEPTVVATAPTNATDPDVTFYQVFQAYVQARERCRESVEGLSYDLFRKRLTESRAAILRDHGCQTVEFHVYVKDGKAALRAVPGWS